MQSVKIRGNIPYIICIGWCIWSWSMRKALGVGAYPYTICFRFSIELWLNNRNWPRRTLAIHIGNSSARVVYRPR